MQLSAISVEIILPERCKQNAEQPSDKLFLDRVFERETVKINSRDKLGFTEGLTDLINSGFRFIFYKLVYKLILLTTDR